MVLSDTDWNSGTSQNVTIVNGTITQTGTPTRVVSTNNPTSNTVTIESSGVSPTPTANANTYGFTENSTPVDHDDCAFGFNFYNGYVYVNESGFLGNYNEAFNASAKYKVEVIAATVKYYFNDVLRFTSTGSHGTFDYTNTYYIYSAKSGATDYTLSSQDDMSASPPSSGSTTFPPSPAYVRL